jgi:hypothetical protein
MAASGRFPPLLARWLDALIEDGAPKTILLQVVLAQVALLAAALTLDLGRGTFSADGWWPGMDGVLGFSGPRRLLPSSPVAVGSAFGIAIGAGILGGIAVGRRPARSVGVSAMTALVVLPWIGPLGRVLLHQPGYLPLAGLLVAWAVGAMLAGSFAGRR